MLKYILLFFFFATVLAEIPDIEPERMMTDFKGLAYNGENVVAYGDYGIITYSTDLGKSWDQVNIGDKHNLLNMWVVDSNFIATSNTAYVKSENGIDWEVSEFDAEVKIKSACVIDKEIYALSSDGLYALDESKKFTKIFNIYSDDSINNIKAKDKNIYYISNNINLLRFNVETKKLDSLLTSESDFYSDFYNACRNLGIINNNIYIEKYNIGLNNGNIMFSTDSGQTWTAFKFNLSKYAHFISGSSLYYLSTKSIKYQEIYQDTNVLNSNINFPNLKKIIDTDSSVSVTDSNFYYKTIFPNISFSRDDINEMVCINDSIIVAVGKDKTIMLSNDLGKTFEYVSNASFSLSSSSPAFFYFDKNDIFVSDYFNSTNGGITWQPPELTEENYTDQFTLKFESRESKHFQLPNNDIVVGHSGAVNYFVKTSDFDSSYNYQRLDSGERIGSLANSPEGASYKGRILFSGFGSIDGNYYSNVNIFDDKLNFIKTVIIDSIRIRRIFKTEEDKLLTFGYRRGKHFDTDSGRVWLDRRYVALESNDNGDSWQIINDKLPVTDKYDIPYGIEYYYAFYKYKNHVIFNNNRVHDLSYLYRYNINTNTMDSVSLPAPPSNINFWQTYFVFRDKLFYISNEYDLYYTENFGSNDIAWQKIDISKYFNNWDPFDNDNREEDKDVIFAAYPDSSQIRLILGRSYITSSFNTYSYKFNYAKLFKEENGTSVIENYDTERDYLWGSEPYPNPATNEIKSRIYLNIDKNLNNVKIQIFNVFGSKIENPDIKLERSSASGSLLKWNCAGVKPGVYLINISLPSRSQTLKVVVKR